MSRPTHRMRLSPSFRDHMLIAALCDWLGVFPNVARVALALYRESTPTCAHVIAQRIGSRPRAVAVYVSWLRQSVPGIIEGPCEGYVMKAEGRAEMLAIFRAAHDALGEELGVSGQVAPALAIVAE